MRVVVVRVVGVSEGGDVGVWGDVSVGGGVGVWLSVVR